MDYYFLLYGNCVQIFIILIVKGMGIKKRTGSLSYFKKIEGSETGRKKKNQGNVSNI